MNTLTLHDFPQQTAIPQVIHESVRREIARMNTAISQATQNSPIKVSLTWRPQPRFVEQLSQQVIDCINGDTLAGGAAAAPSFTLNLTDREKSLANLERYVTRTVQGLEKALAAFKAAAAEIDEGGQANARS